MKANSPIEQQKCEGHEKPDRLPNSKMEFNHQISQQNIISPIDPVFFPNWSNFIKRNKRSEDSYICLADFYFFSFRKSKVCSCSILIFRGLTCDFSLSSVHLYFKRKANSTIEQQNCKGHEKRDRLLILKEEINFQISQLNKSFDPVFSYWVNFIKKVFIINCSTNSKSFKAMFFFRNSKVEDL